MKNKGFSLVELIVVIAIMAVLVGVIAPQFLGYVKSAKEAVAKDEVFQVVKVANIKLVENEIEGDDTFDNTIGEAPTDFIDEILATAVAKGEVISLVISNSTVTYTKYTSLNGITAIFDITASPTIYVLDEEESQESKTALYDLARSLLSGVGIDLANNKSTQALQEAYAAENGGELPTFTDTDEWETVKNLMEANDLDFYSETYVDNLKWIPSVNSNKTDVIMYAAVISGSNSSTSGNINNAGFAYYKGEYYYHVHSKNNSTVNGAYVGDNGKFTDYLDDNLGIDGSYGIWKKLE